MTETLTGKQVLALPDRSVLEEHFICTDGVLYWRKRAATHLQVGDVAGWMSADGYARVKIFGDTYLVHRIVWAMHNEETPERLDHINGITSDNRIENLRPASSTDNNRNTKRYKNNSSGVKGVIFNKAGNNFRAYIRKDGKQNHLGYFKTLEEAKIVRMAAAEKFFGEFARHA